MKHNAPQHLDERLYSQLELFYNNLPYSPQVKKALIKELLIMYDYNTDIPLLKGLDTIDKETAKAKLDEHTLMFIEGDGSLRSGRRDEGQRYSPNITIKLHEDDTEYLEMLKNTYKVKNKLSTEKAQKSIVLLMYDKDVLLQLMPLLDKHLLTKSAYNYKIWKEIFFIWHDKTLSKNEKLRKLDILSLSLNKSQDKNYYPDNLYVRSRLNITKFVGFSEAEASFSVRYSNNKYRCVYEITQKTTNDIIIQEMLWFLNNLSPDTNCPYKVKLPTTQINFDNTKTRFSYTKLDNLFWVLVPKLIVEPFHTRKKVDFLLWAISIIILKTGLHHTPEGVKLLEHIKHSNNSDRYGTNNQFIPKLDEILKVLNMEHPYDFYKTHERNGRDRASLTRKSRNKKFITK